MTRWVRDQAAARRFDLVFAYSSTAAQYILGSEFAGTRRIVDFVDVDSDKWRQYAANKSWPASAVYGRESRTLLGFERRVAAAVDTSLLVSPQEAELFRRLAPANAARIDHVTNGVDHLYFDPAEAFPNPFDDGAETLVFTGAMDYWANVDAVVWFATEILPA
ncbi:MAG: sugar transferase, partial [Alphaproteobacteria bacterium]|nr:sugar transferase [Alphaproteobacteria bacterium]